MHDSVRAGAVRFKHDEQGPFLASNDEPIPPLVRLGDLLAASDAVQHGEKDLEALRASAFEHDDLREARRLVR